MPQRRARSGSTGTSVSKLQSGRPRRTSYLDGGQQPVGCLAGSCSLPPMEAAPVQLCGKHVREVWQYAQGVIENRLISAAASAIE